MVLGIDSFREKFKDYTEYYTMYTLDRATSLTQRFRTGEAPIIIWVLWPAGANLGA